MINTDHENSSCVQINRKRAHSNKNIEDALQLGFFRILVKSDDDDKYISVYYISPNFEFLYDCEAISHWILCNESFDHLTANSFSFDLKKLSNHVNEIEKLQSTLPSFIKPSLNSIVYTESSIDEPPVKKRHLESFKVTSSINNSQIKSTDALKPTNDAVDITDEVIEILDDSEGYCYKTADLSNYNIRKYINEEPSEIEPHKILALEDCPNLYKKCLDKFSKSQNRKLDRRYYKKMLPICSSLCAFDMDGKPRLAFECSFCLILWHIDCSGYRKIDYGNITMVACDNCYQVQIATKLEFPELYNDPEKAFLQEYSINSRQLEYIQPIFNLCKVQWTLERSHSNATSSNAVPEIAKKTNNPDENIKLNLVHKVQVNPSVSVIRESNTDVILVKFQQNQIDMLAQLFADNSCQCKINNHLIPLNLSRLTVQTTDLHVPVNARIYSQCEATFYTTIQNNENLNIKLRHLQKANELKRAMISSLSKSMSNGKPLSKQLNSSCNFSVTPSNNSNITSVGSSVSNKINLTNISQHFPTGIRVIHPGGLVPTGSIINSSGITGLSSSGNILINGPIASNINLNGVPVVSSGHLATGSISSVSSTAVNVPNSFFSNNTNNTVNTPVITAVSNGVLSAHNKSTEIPNNRTISTEEIIKKKRKQNLLASEDPTDTIDLLDDEDDEEVIVETNDNIKFSKETNGVIPHKSLKSPFRNPNKLMHNKFYQYLHKKQFNITKLPWELLLKILSSQYLPIEALLNCRAVCKCFKTIIDCANTIKKIEINVKSISNIREMIKFINKLNGSVEKFVFHIDINHSISIMVFDKFIELHPNLDEIHKLSVKFFGFSLKSNPNKLLIEIDKHFKNLVNLSICSEDPILLDVAPNHLLNMKTLRKLKLKNVRNIDQVLMSIVDSCLPNLNKLIIGDWSLSTNFSPMNYSQLTDLSILFSKDVNIENIEVLKRLSNVKCLHVYKPYLTTELKHMISTILDSHSQLVKLKLDCLVMDWTPSNIYELCYEFASCFQSSAASLIDIKNTKQESKLCLTNGHSKSLTIQNITWTIYCTKPVFNNAQMINQIRSILQIHLPCNVRFFLKLDH